MYLWKKDILYLLLAGLCAVLVWRFTGYFLESLLLISLSYSIRLVYLTQQLERSLHSGIQAKNAPKDGIWGKVYQHVFHTTEANIKRQKKLTRIIKKFSKSTAALPDAIVVLGKKNEIRWFNPAAKSVLGLRKKDKGEYILNLIHTPAFISFIQDKKTNTVLNIKSPTDERITLQIKIASYDKNSHLLVAHDISYLKNIERMRKDFVDNISHELRTPLTVLKGYLETLLEMEDENPSPLLIHSLQQMSNQSQRMQSLVDDLLLLANLETEKSEQLQVNIPALLEQVCQESKVLGLTENRIQLITDCQQGLKGNGQELHSVFSNLIINALKYSADDSVVTVHWYQEKQHLILDVIDQGEGIAEEDLPKITERFYRVDVKRTREARGTGLGLAIVKHGLARHDAQLVINSELGKGSTFRCVFPEEGI